MEQKGSLKCPECKKTLEPWGLNGRNQVLFKCINITCSLGGPSPLGMTEYDIIALDNKKQRIVEAA